MLLGLLLVVLILVCIALGGVVLLQRSEGGALGMGGGPSGFLTTRGAGDLLTRITWALGGVLFALCLALTVIQGRMHKGASVVDRLRIDPLSGDQLNSAKPATPPPASAPANTVTGFEAPTPQVNAAPRAGLGAAPAPTSAPAAAPAPKPALVHRAPAAAAPKSATPAVAPAADTSPKAASTDSAPAAAPAPAAPSSSGNGTGG